MKRVLQDLKPHIVWNIFEEITTIPRPSKKEQKIIKWVKEWANQNNISCEEDDMGNILLRKEAANSDAYPTLILQAHMDMVCQKNPDLEIDFENDPIPIQKDDEYVTSEGTSLGADNGIGMAIALAALIEPTLVHGPLEVLMTVDEETGLNGAFNINPDFFSGKYLLNLDWEKIGEIIISSAGGGNVTISLPYERQKKEAYTGITIHIEGLKGGHSGLDIHLQRLNAIKMLVEAIKCIKDKNFIISEIQSGTASNTIPRCGECTLLFLEKDKKSALTDLEKWKTDQIKNMKSLEPDLEITLSETLNTTGLSHQKSNALFTLLREIPQGPLSFSEEIEGLVQTSNNLGVITTEEDTITIIVHSRSSVQEELETLRNKLHSLSIACDATVTMGNTYPGWKSSPKTPFVSYIKKVYESFHPVTFEGIHAGLECGVLSELDPQLELASIGPEIENAHTPRERVNIESVQIIWKIIKRIIINMKIL